MTKEKIIVTSGDFDPITTKELQFLKKCRAKGDWLVVGMHSDIAVHMKTAKLNQTYDDRNEILSNIKCVDEIFRFNDADGTVCNLLKLVKLCYPLAEITYISEHDMHNMPETKIRGITFEVLKA
jgi:bifunctional ADP-heptose synthase (sugar kinase/adenylyltransferase)